MAGPTPGDRAPRRRPGRRRAPRRRRARPGRRSSTRPLRPRLPPRLPADRQPARRRGPHPGGLRPRLPRRCRPTRPAPSRAGCTGSPPTSSSTRRAASSGSASTPWPTTPADRLAGREPGPGAGVRRHAPSTTTSSARSTTLPPDFRAAVVLCDVEGLSYEEIADILGVKLGTVRSRIHRGRAQLRAALAHRAPRTGTATRMPAAPAGGARPMSRDRTRLAGLADGRLDPSAAERVLAHVVVCVPCRRELIAQRQVRAQASDRAPGPDRRCGAAGPADPVAADGLRRRPGRRVRRHRRPGPERYRCRRPAAAVTSYPAGRRRRSRGRGPGRRRGDRWVVGRLGAEPARERPDPAGGAGRRQASSPGAPRSPAGSR